MLDIPSKDIINVLQIRDESDFTKVHFILIRNFSRFMASETAYNAKGGHFHWCTSCLSASFITEESLKEHQTLCMKNECIRCVLPEAGKPNSFIKFRNRCNEFKHPFACFADMESTLMDVDITAGEGTKRIKKHVANSIGIKFDCIHEEFSLPIQIINNSNPEELMKEAIRYFKELSIYSYGLTQRHKKFNFNTLSYEQREDFNSQTCCGECKCVFDDEKHAQCAHHDHITGQFLGTLCKSCNFEFCIKKFMPIYFHNLKGYDSHFIVLALAEDGEDEAISCIPNNEEKYISFSKSIKVDQYVDKKGIDKDVRFEMRFLDTLAFMGTSCQH